LGRPMPDLCAGNRDGLGTSGTSTKCSSRSGGERHCLWRAVDQDGDVIDVLVTKGRDRRAAQRFFRKALKHQGQVPWQPVTYKLRTYRAAHREVFPSVMHRTGRYENNRAEVSHHHTREQEKQMRRFNSPLLANGFYQCTVRFKTCSGSEGTISNQLAIDSSVIELSVLGASRRVPAERGAITPSGSAKTSLWSLT